jgi:hypothetical protein
MNRRKYKKAIKWFIANRFCLIDPIPPIKGRYKLMLWNKWHKFNHVPIHIISSHLNTKTKGVKDLEYYD